MTVTNRAALACNGWLQTCLQIGWRKGDLSFLCDLWWKYHDDDGNLFPPGESRPTSQSGES